MSVDERLEPRVGVLDGAFGGGVPGFGLGGLIARRPRLGGRQLILERSHRRLRLLDRTLCLLLRADAVLRWPLRLRLALGLLRRGPVRARGLLRSACARMKRVLSRS